jgi:diguanylate cyclase (GGDEF)-like protein
MRGRLPPLLDLPDADLEDALDALREEAAEEGFPLHSELVRELASLPLSEEEARTVWEAIRRHRVDLQSRLGRDPGIRVAACDLLVSRTGVLPRAVFVERTGVDRAERSAGVDPLTGLPGPAAFGRAVSREIRRCARGLRRASVVILDLDRFSGVNGSLGRAGADALLREAGALVDSRLRGGDLAARGEGASFALLLPRTGRLGAYVASERVLRSLRERLRLGASAGVGVYPEDGETRAALLRSARRALSRAKSDGGGRVCPHSADRRGSVRLRPAGRMLHVRAFRGGGLPPEVLRVQDLSQGGARLSGPRPPLPGEEIELRISPVGPEPDLVLPAVVTRSAPRGGLPAGPTGEAGVRFLVDRADQREALGRLLEGVRLAGVEEAPG